MAALTFTQALAQAETQARSTLDVALHERLSCAVALVKDGAVFQEGDHVWTVASASTPGKAYRPNGTCSCEDMHYNKPRYCKHQLAMFLHQRAFTLMRQPQAAPVVPEAPPVEPWSDNDPEEPDAPAPAPAPTPAPLGEAPASVNCHITIAGRQVQLTLRDTDEGRLLARLQAVLAQYPVQTPPATQPTDATPQCPQHGAMKASSKGKGWYCPHKNGDDTWCQHKAK